MPLNVPSWPDLLGAAEHSAVHPETRDAYAVDYETGPFADWRAGHRHDPDDRAAWWRPWLDLIAATVARGVTVRRARIVSEPVSEYTRFLYDGTFTNVAAGEEVRWLPGGRPVTSPCRATISGSSTDDSSAGTTSPATGIPPAER